MSRRDLQRRRRHADLSHALRAIRRLRGLRTQEVAQRMGLELRAYERFEACEGRLDVERIFLFAEVTDCDPLAILCAVQLGRPELAEQCADNKLALIFAIALERFSRQSGAHIPRLDAATLIDVFERGFDALGSGLEAREAQARAWFAVRRDGGADD